MMSYFLEITENDAEYGAPVFAGQLNGKLPEFLCACPNCAAPMFPVFSVSKDIPGMPAVDCYDQHGMLTLDVCASCTHWLKNYYTRSSDGRRSAYLGDVAPGGPINFLDQPFQSRSVNLVTVGENQWSDPVFQEEYFSKSLLNGVLHQLGGTKMKAERIPLLDCLHCHGELKFLGTVDSDDLNIPLYENGVPINLEIADAKSLNVFTCQSCSAVNYGLTK